MKKRKKNGGLLLNIVLGTVLTIGFFSAIGYAASYSVTQSRHIASISEFPESYQAGLTAIKEALPNAQFILYDTGLDWYTDLLDSDNEMYFGRNLVPVSSSYLYLPSSYRDTTMSESYNWAADEYVEVEPGWNQASKEAIEYYMDPRNFLTAELVFQFEQLTYNADLHTLAGVESILSGTFMDKANMTEMLVDEDGNEYTYAEAFMKFGEELGVSPYLLASRVRQEQGEGKSDLISGTYAGADGIYKGYYNYFNICAYGDTTDEIIQAGLKEAKDEGWDTRYKALYGGATKLANMYVKSGKDTFYLQHFNVSANSSGTVYYYPYMTNVLAPTSESSNVYRSYQNTGCTDSSFVFVIPVYKNMPATACPKPTKDGNPNNKLKGLSLNNGDISIGTFGIDTMSYSAIVDYEISNVRVSAAIFNTYGSIMIAGQQCTTGVTDVAAYVDLQVGSNTIPVQITAENGDVRTYTITVYRNDDTGATPTYSSSYINGDYAKGITPGTTVETFLASFKLEHCTAKVMNADGTAASSSDIMKTGQKVVITQNDGTDTEIKSYTVLIYGDCSGDGKINAADTVKVKRNILGLASLSGIYFTAADIDGNEKLNAADTVKIKRHILGIQTITQ